MHYFLGNLNTLDCRLTIPHDSFYCPFHLIRLLTVLFFSFVVKPSQVNSLLKQHNIKSCFVRLHIEPEVDQMASGALRRSNRIRTKTSLGVLHKPKPAKIQNRRKTSAEQSNLSQPKKPILLKKSTKRLRSKSVTFDLPPLAPQQQQATTSQHASDDNIRTQNIVSSASPQPQVTTSQHASNDNTRSPNTVLSTGPQQQQAAASKHASNDTIRIQNMVL